MTFHPAWITRSVTTHDPWGHNGDGHGNGVAVEGDYRVLFHGKGEGRILRMWMTTRDAAADYQELRIVIDGQTIFSGKPVDFFASRGPWQNPLVYDFEQSSGAYLSYVPFPYSKEAKILFKGNPSYYQVTYREGAGSSAGPTPEQLRQFLTEDWVAPLEAKLGAAQPIEAGKSLVLATGPVTVDGLALKLDDLAGLSVRVGDQAPVPAPFFFGLASLGDEPLERGWQDNEYRNSLHSVQYAKRLVATRLPIPLAEGETLRLEASTAAQAGLTVAVATELSAARPGVRLLAQYRDQRSPGTETTMPLFEYEGAAQFVSLIHSITDGKLGDRSFLEGDEMIRTDGMHYPLQLGTGTEDYFNGGWYFLGPHANPLSGQPRFIVNDPEDGWSHARYEHSLYRHHVLDPVVSRSHLRFGFEAGETGSYTPLRVRTLGFAYAFEGVKRLDARQVAQTVQLPGGSSVTSAFDAERAEPYVTKNVSSRRGRTELRFACPSKAQGMLLVRTYDAAKPSQEARVLMGSGGSREVGSFYESFSNSGRRFAQDSLWIDFAPRDCQNGTVAVTVDSSRSPVDFTEIEYEAQFYDLGMTAPVVTAGEMMRFLNVTSEPADPRDPASPRIPFYVNDHTAIQDVTGAWHFYGIFHAEPMGSSEEVELMHATCREPDPANWEWDSCRLEPGVKRSVLTADARLGETHLWAPHVGVDPAGGWFMAFHSGFTDNDRAGIKLAHSTDLSTWTRDTSAPAFEDICVARDPMIRRQGALWVMYYTRCDSKESHQSGVAYRTSVDGKTWSEPAMALVLKDTPPMFNSGYTESPFVFERDGWFYLSVTSYPVEWNASFLYRSRTPFHFEPVAIARLPSHAPEWLAKDGDFEHGQLFLTHAGAGQGGLWKMPIFGL